MIGDLLDGRLTGEDRTAAFARIDADEALYEVFVETVRFRAANRGRGPGGGPGVASADGDEVD